MFEINSVAVTVPVNIADAAAKVPTIVVLPVLDATVNLFTEESFWIANVLPDPLIVTLLLKVDAPVTFRISFILVVPLVESSVKSPDAVSIVPEAVCPIRISSIYAAENFWELDPTVGFWDVSVFQGSKLDLTVVTPVM